jgi:hypothetical protein
MYVRKTKDLWVIETWYNPRWEVVSYDETRKEARQTLKDYRDNQPEYAHRMRLTREKITT